MIRYLVHLKDLMKKMLQIIIIFETNNIKTQKGILPSTASVINVINKAVKKYTARNVAYTDTKLLF